MSGGSYNYAYSYVRDFIEMMKNRKPTELRKQFAEHLELVATAMHDVEWVDSDDRSRGDEDDAIRKVLGIEAQAARGVVPVEVREGGWQWRPVDSDTAFAPPFGTIRKCRGCGCLVAGGPAYCKGCG